MQDVTADQKAREVERGENQRRVYSLFQGLNSKRYLELKQPIGARENQY